MVLWKRPFSSYVFLWMTLGLMALTLFLVAGAVASRERDRWVNHTLDVLQNLERYEASVLAAQVQLNQKAPWLDQNQNRRGVEASLAMARQSIDRLIQLTADSDRQSVRARVLKSLTGQVIERIRAQWTTPPLIGLPVQNVWSDLPIADTISEIRKDERALLEQRQSERSNADETFWIFTVVVVVANLVIVWWAYGASRRYMLERNRTEIEVRELNARLADQVFAFRGLNATLEHRVAEKTGELEATVAKLKATNLELERFAYVASHDMQEPLRQVASFNNLLALKYGDKLDSTANRYLEYSVSGAKRLQLMLRALLQYTVITPAAVYRAEIPVAPMLDSILQELRAEIAEAGATVKVDAASGLCIDGDREMIRTLAQSLISNAIKFRRADHRPEVNVEVVRSPRQWTLTVTDNGIGLEEEFMPRMFEMFARFHPIGQYQGAGVGLALSKRIVDCHGGKFTVLPNAAGPGTVFSAEVPILSQDMKNVLETGQFPY